MATEGELAEGRAVSADGDGVAVCLAKRRADVHAITDVCGHAGGPLHEGELDGEGRSTCPWRASAFRVQDGAVVHGPATGSAPDFETPRRGRAGFGPTSLLTAGGHGVGSHRGRGRG